MKRLIGRLILSLSLSMCVMAGSVYAQGLDSENSPYSYDNSKYNSANSPYNYNNSKYNPKNSIYSNSDRIIYDEQGNATGYAVPKEGGGVNYFEYDKTDRTGYQPGDRINPLPQGLAVFPAGVGINRRLQPTHPG